MPPLLPRPEVRLAVISDGMPSKLDRYPEALCQPNGDSVIASPIGRLAMQSKQGGNSDGNAKGFYNPAPEVRLAHVPCAQGDNVLLGQRGVAAMGEDQLPGLLVSYYYLPAFLANRHRYHYRDWVMDSGAFSAYNSGVTISLQDYIDCCKRLMVEDPSLVEIYSLDVIGDWEGSLKNAEEMWSQGVPAIPCFHYGEPWEVLMRIAKDYPKIALGGCVGKRDKNKFAGQVFARVWPKKVHGFGFGSEESIMTLPFHSVDATNWEMSPCAYGTWRAFGGQRVSVRGSSQNLRVEVEWYLELERKARNRWRKEMAKLEDLCPTRPLTDQCSIPLPYSVRLADQAGARQEAKAAALGSLPIPGGWTPPTSKKKES